MKLLVLALVLLGGPTWHLLTSVRERNAAVASGAAAYQRGNATAAIAAFEAALAASGRRSPDSRLVLNLGHAQVRAGRAAAAHATYGRLLSSNSSPAALTSVARQQLAVLAARQGETAQALNLLRQALLLDANNAGARFDYEALSEYLAKRPNAPRIPPPTPKPESKDAKPSPDKQGAAQSQPASKAGTDRQGQVNDQKPTTAPAGAPERRPNQAGQPDNQRPAGAPGTDASGSLGLGAGPTQPLASGDAPGAQRGLDRGSSSPAPPGKARGNQPGTDEATPDDTRLQTQRERLQAMNLSPAQARQLLETLRAQEQQYLQQLSRPARKKPDPNKPTW